MNRMLVIAAATLLAGAAYAQQSPVLQGNYSDSVLDAYNGPVTVVTRHTDSASSMAPALPDSGPAVLARLWNPSGR